MRPETWLVLVGAMGVGAVVGLWPTPRPDSTGDPTAAQVVTGCRVTDGDTIRCGSERVRLLGIDSPELPGHCRPGRACVAGDPFASTASLERAISPEMTISRVGEDAYGRTLAVVAGRHGDLSCWQLRQRQAIYKPAWDNGMRVARACPGALL